MAGDALKAALLEKAKREQASRAKASEKGWGQTIKENVLGDDDPTTQNFGERVATLLNMGGEALTLGLVGDEAAARFDSLIGRGSYDDRLNFYRQQEEIAREEAPVTSFAAEVAPAALLPAAGLASKGPMALRALKSALTAATTGGFYGFMEGEGGKDNRLRNARNVAGLSGALGMAAPFVSRGLERRLNRRGERALTRTVADNALSSDDLRAVAGPVFDRAAQVQIPQSGLAQVAVDAAQEIRPNMPINPRITPLTAELVDELTDVATDPNTPNVSFGVLDDIRKQTAAARGNFANPTEQRGGAIVAKAIDNFVEEVDPALGKDIAKARDMWGRLRRNELIEEAVAKAQLQASGFENGLRIQIRQILNNKKKVAGFSKAEREAMEQIVEGTKFGNLLKRVGKLGFGRGQQTNVLSGTAGAAVFGPSSIAAGQGALVASEKLTARQVRQLQDLIRGGGLPNAPTVNQLAPQLPGLLEAGTRALAPRASEAYMAR